MLVKEIYIDSLEMCRLLGSAKTRYSMETSNLWVFVFFCANGHTSMGFDYILKFNAVICYSL